MNVTSSERNVEKNQREDLFVFRSPFPLLICGNVRMRMKTHLRREVFTLLTVKNSYCRLNLRSDWSYFQFTLLIMSKYTHLVPKKRTYMYEWRDICFDNTCYILPKMDNLTDKKICHTYTRKPEYNQIIAVSVRGGNKKRGNWLYNSAARLFYIDWIIPAIFSRSE